MAAGRIIEGFDVVKNHRFGLSPGWRGLVFEAFGFEGCPEGFSDGVVITVTASAHALIDGEIGKRGGEVTTGVLAALVAVVDEA